MDDLVEFLRARYDDDERDAIAARDDSTGPYASVGDATWHVSDGDGGIWTDEHGIPVAPGPIGDAAAHIALWDPARVLAEVEAKRRIIAWAEQAGPAAFSPNDSLASMTTITDGRYRILGDVIRVLAAVYADHPDYQQEWRP